VDGKSKPGRVQVSWLGSNLDIDFESARKLARAILDQADISELESMR
jgi:hypothetical protein